jgi:hypothetical protein
MITVSVGCGFVHVTTSGYLHVVVIIEHLWSV